MQKNISVKTLAVFGLGKLGATLAVVLGEAGHQIRGYDPSPLAVESLNQGEPLIFEPGLADLMASTKDKVSAYLRSEDALRGTSGAFIIVPTPSGPDGAFDNTFVISALRDIGKHLALHPRSFTIVISSTVMPGSCNEVFIGELEVASGVTVGSTLSLAYSPEFIALGSVINDMKHPDLVLIGESDPSAGDFVEEVSRSVVQNKPEFRRMSLASAELAKIAINTFVTTKISYANMLSEICDQLPGASIDDVTAAVGSDARIGRSYLTAGLGYGGPCFPRDNKALAVAALSRGVNAEIAVATDLINDRQIERVVKLVLQHSSRGDSVAIVGLAYKGGTPLLEASQAMEIARQLIAEGRNVFGLDELVRQATHGSNLEGITLAKDTTEIAHARVLVAGSKEKLSRLIPREHLPKTVIDLFGVNQDLEATIVRPGSPGLRREKD